MPRTDPSPVWNEVSAIELWAKIAGGTRFSLDDYDKQLDASETAGEDFRLTHNNVNYIIPLGRLREYFAEHPRPTRKMTKDQELEFLRKRVKEQEAILVESGIMKPAPEQAAAFVRQSSPLEVAEPLDDIPAPSPEKQTISQVQDQLAADLIGQKPVSRSSRVVKNAKPASHSPSV